jgi:chaperonin GroES
MKPLRNNILVKRAELATKSAGGIILTNESQEAPNEGEVLACGKGVYQDGTLLPMEVSVGDTILFPAFAGTEVKNGSEMVLIMADTDVLAVL